MFRKVAAKGIFLLSDVCFWAAHKLRRLSDHLYRASKWCYEAA